MSEDSNFTIRLSKAAKEFNVGMGTILDFLAKKGFQVDSSPNTKLTADMYALLVKEYQGEREVKNEAKKLGDLSYKGGSVSVDSTTQTIASKEEEEDAEVVIRSTTISHQSTKPVTKETKAEPEPATQPEPVKPAETKPEAAVEETKKEETTESPIKVLGKIDLDSLNPKKKKQEEPKKESKKQEPKKKEEKAVETPKVETKPVVEKKAEEKKQEPAPVEPRFIKTEVKKLDGPKILDKIELPEERKRTKQQPVASSETGTDSKKKKRKRIAGKPEAIPGKGTVEPQGKQKPKKEKGKPQPKHEEKVELSDEEISKQIKDTLARLSPMGKSKTSKHRREKRQQVAGSMMEEQMRQQEEQSVLKVTEFVTANDLAVMMNVPVVKVIAACMTLGMPVSINQRLDAEALTVVAETFGFKVDFVSADVQEAIAETEEVDREEDMVPRAPVVTVMGHVDHGKTKLLDYIRNTNVVAGEAGGITQHIGAYEVTTASGKKITFLDTPGHEAFTAMRARGAKMTDVAIIVIATDDNVMPQTVEAINHAQAAGVPIVFALNKIDKPTANPDKIREQLSKMNILVESWGGKYQEQEIAAKTGLNVEELLEKVLLEAEFLDLKANPNKLAKGTVIESALDKGRGYVAKILVQSGTLRIGDMVLAGTNYGKVKAMFNDHNQKVTEAGPSTPVLLLGLNGAPQPGDTFNVMTDEREVKDIATRREQLQREQARRTSPHITLDEIGRRIAIGDFKELNIIVKADVDGSVEALSDSLLKLSTEEVQVNVIHKSVGAISESDIMLASASNAVIVGFNVRPTVQARKLAEQEKIDIRIYSIIYTAIEEIKAAIEGMLSPEIEEVVTCNLEIRETFKISKVGTIAGCMVLDGKITRNTKIRIIRDGIVIYTGTLGSLKRFKDDVKEVPAGMDCGLNIENFNDIKVGDIIEGYTEKEVARKL
ncbi:MAG: translation initiation factor IF-2 [Bacteroidales bacterium]|nr:translation initiation factor IF-2 [Bacteroidales bacterium]